LVWALACSVFCLANLAKASQYPTDSTPRNYLSKSTKMSGERSQIVSVAILPAAPAAAPLYVRIHEIQEPAETVPASFVFLRAFRFRPPPTPIA